MKAILMLLLLSFSISGMNPEQKNSSAGLKKIATLEVTIYRDPEYDEDAWKQIMDRMELVKKAKFSAALLKETFDFMFTESLNAKGIWGGKDVSYIEDAEKIDGPKKGPSSNSQ